MIAVVAGCQQSQTPPVDRGSGLHSIARVDAQLRDAASVADAEVIPAFDFTGSGVPTGFGGVTLGDALPAIAQQRGTFGGAGAQLSVASDDGTTVSQITIWLDGDVESSIEKRFGAPRHWKGSASWLIAAPEAFDFSGSVSTRLVIVPPDEHHVCGRDDGFAAFYAALQRSVGAKDWPTVARSMTFPQTDWADAEGADESIHLDGPGDLAAHPSEVFRMALRGGAVTCDLGNRMYIVTFGTARLSPAIYAARGIGGVWQVTGVGHAPHDLF